MLLTIRDIKKTFGTLEVLKGVNLDINDGERIGIVGRNGAGKTTLANIIFGSLKADSGYILRKNSELKIGYLLQSVSYTVNTFSNMLDSGDAEEAGSFSATAGSLGLKNVQHWEADRLEGLSGGERTKIALAKVLVTRPDLLILDEPTNHLDFQGVEWLAGELLKFRGAILVISHDRYFLDKIASRIVEIDEGKAASYSGNYSFYRDEKKRQYEEQLHQYIEQEKRKEKIEAEIERVKQWSAKAHRDSTKKGEGAMGAKEFYRLSAKRMDRRAKSQVKRLERMKSEGIEKPKDEPELNFRFEDGGKHGRRILEAKDITKSFGSRTLFKNTSFFIQRGEKVGVLGPNGCGKTTLVKMILGQEKYDSGEIWFSPSSHITYISQDVEDLHSDRTPLEVLKATDGENRAFTRTILAGMGIGESMLREPVRNMSLGERTRIKIAGAILDGNDFLVLDEPTNHLDLYSREQLEDAIGTFDGTVLVISHDRYMLEKVCDRMLVFEGNRILRIEGGFNEWREREKRSFSMAKVDPAYLKEEKMLLENKLAVLITRLSILPKEDPAYESLDLEYRELIEKRKNLNSITVK